MSMVRQLIGAVSNAQRQIDDQMMKLSSYTSEIDTVSQRVTAALEGGDMPYAQQMQQQLSHTKRQVEETLAYLQQAKDKLHQVRTVL